MFGLMKNLYHYLKEVRERKVTLVLIGLDNAGKTTTLGNIRGQIPAIITPTFGFNTGSAVQGRYFIDLFDLGGGKNVRSMWDKYYAEVHGAIFVVDAADHARFGEAKAVLADALKDPMLSNKPILIFANKQDLPAAKSAPEVALELGLATLRNDRYQIMACTALARPGEEYDINIRHGVKWVLDTIESEYKTLTHRVKLEGEAAKEEAARKAAERKARVDKMRAERKREEKEAQAKKEADEQRHLLAKQGAGGTPLVSSSPGGPNNDPDELSTPVISKSLHGAGTTGSHGKPPLNLEVITPNSSDHTGPSALDPMTGMGPPVGSPNVGRVDNHMVAGMPGRISDSPKPLQWTGHERVPRRVVILVGQERESAAAGSLLRNRLKES
eukprot:jgi/Mesvir1/21051/Mv16542-RA.1